LVYHRIRSVVKADAARPANVTLVDITELTCGFGCSARGFQSWDEGGAF